MPPHDDKQNSDVPSVLRVIFPQFDDEELARASTQLANYFRFVYVKFQDEIEKAISESPFEK